MPNKPEVQLRPQRGPTHRNDKNHNNNAKDYTFISRSSHNIDKETSLLNRKVQTEFFESINEQLESFGINAKKDLNEKEKDKLDNMVLNIRKLREVYEKSVDICILANSFAELQKSLIYLVETLYLEDFLNSSPLKNRQGYYIGSNNYVQLGMLVSKADDQQFKLIKHAIPTMKKEALLAMKAGYIKYPVTEMLQHLLITNKDHDECCQYLAKNGIVVQEYAVPNEENKTLLYAISIISNGKSGITVFNKFRPNPVSLPLH
ncbi:hypothetical protein H4219_003662 [Mycoemilia scoparia]|uniref:Uncharacterized protein n=1 Tax=Mycoemilia scoparia TaxID=417184 RepID=A0A9W8A0M3_9FUNG|nr:hypothetical protein H4219_003662 [Mycoemilia scoparia]